MRKSNISIFVPHIGCPHKCSFCNQNTITGQTSAPTAQDVRDTVETALNSNGDGRFEYEIAFFGGSFTAIDREYMVSLLEAAYPYVKNGSVKGIRISTRPDFIDDEILSILKKYGITSIELGAQNMNDKVLAANLRGHTAEDVRNAANLIKKRDFELGLQMMTDLYMSNRGLDFATAREFAKLKPKTVRIYPTVVLKGTYLAKLYESGEYKPTPLKKTVALCADLVEFFEQHDIDVIRVGLHSSSDVKENMLAGGYHECLGEMVISKMMFNQILRTPPGEHQVFINQKSISKLLGNKKSNLAEIEKAGYKLEIKYNNALGPNELRII
jgi:histone acetyltransferase (RNA polymerase elongator complex component)